jgi:hypothetical protein
VTSWWATSRSSGPTSLLTASFAEHDGEHHQQEAYFFCELPPGAEPRLIGGDADTWQTGVAWLPLDRLARGPFTTTSPRPMKRYPARITFKRRADRPAVAAGIAVKRLAGGLAGSVGEPVGEPVFVLVMEISPGDR